MPENILVADEKIFCVVAPRFGVDRLERDFRADAGDIAEGNADEYCELRIANCELNLAGAHLIHHSKFRIRNFRSSG